MTELEARIVRLEQVSDRNTKVFIDAVQFLELKLNVLQRALQDVADGCLVRVDGAANGTPIDFEWYMKHALEKLQKTEDKVNEVSVVAVPEADSTVIFGG
jgi:hypothetical protein